MLPTHIKFNFQYDCKQLQQELDNCLQREWPLHFNSKDFNGDWRSISLRSKSGKANDIYAHAGQGIYQDTPLLTETPYIKEIIDSWKCEKEAIRLLALAPGSIIKPHRDPGCAYKDGVLRIHIPVVTNPGVRFTINNHNLRLLEGECWYMDFSSTHSIVNEGTSTRVHLIIDGIRNDWTDRLFEKHGYKIADEPKANEFDEETRNKIIAELELQDTDTARSIIASLKGITS